MQTGSLYKIHIRSYKYCPEKFLCHAYDILLNFWGLCLIDWTLFCPDDDASTSESQKYEPGYIVISYKRYLLTEGVHNSEHVSCLLLDMILIKVLTTVNECVAVTSILLKIYMLLTVSFIRRWCVWKTECVNLYKYYIYNILYINTFVLNIYNKLWMIYGLINMNCLIKVKYDAEVTFYNVCSRFCLIYLTLRIILKYIWICYIKLRLMGMTLPWNAQDGSKKMNSKMEKVGKLSMFSYVWIVYFLIARSHFIHLGVIIYTNGKTNYDNKRYAQV